MRLLFRISDISGDTFLGKGDEWQPVKVTKQASQTHGIFVSVMALRFSSQVDQQLTVTPVSPSPAQVRPLKAGTSAAIWLNKPSMLTKLFCPARLKTSSWRISHSGRASPGGSTALKNFCTRPLRLVKVPRFSA